MIDRSRIRAFKIIEYLTDRSIDFITSGKDVTEGWIGIPCVWCSDHGHHLGINIENKAVSCWRCGPHGDIINLIKQIDNCGFAGALSILDDYLDWNVSGLPPPTQPQTPPNFQMPSNLQPIDPLMVPDRASAFLKSRGFNPERLCRQKYLLYPNPEFIGQYKFRLVFPITYHGEIVTLVGRDVTGHSKFPYLNHPESQSKRDAKRCLWGFDECVPKQSIVVVEGIFDQLKLGNGSVATLGTQFTHDQVLLLWELEPSKVFILFDSEPEAQTLAEKLAKEIWFCQTEVLSLEGFKDPGELSIEEGIVLMKRIRDDRTPK